MTGIEMASALRVMCTNYPRYRIVYSKQRDGSAVMTTYRKDISEVFDLQRRLTLAGYDCSVHGVNADGSTTVAYF